MWWERTFSMRMSTYRECCGFTTLLYLNHQDITNPSWPSLLTVTDPTLSQTITAETHITAELWQILIDQFNKAQQDDQLNIDLLLKPQVILNDKGNLSKHTLFLCWEMSTAADFLKEIKGCKVSCLFDTGAGVSCISYNCYVKFFY